MGNVYPGSEIKDTLEVGQRAICVVGLYAMNGEFYIEKSNYGGKLIWKDGADVDDSSKYFKVAMWEILVDKYEQTDL